MNLPKSLSTLILRLGIGIVFLFFGVDKFIHPEVWINWVSPRLLYYFPFPQEVFIYLDGGLESVIGVMLILGFYTRIFALIASLLIVGILATVGVTDVTVRDIAILAGALSLVLTGSDKLSVDNKFVVKANKKRPDYIELE